jgi:hypothetical protein
VLAVAPDRLAGLLEVLDIQEDLPSPGPGQFLVVALGAQRLRSHAGGDERP